MSFYAHPGSPFSGMALSTCMSKNPSLCCLSTEAQSATVGINQEFNCYKLSYESGAEVIVSDQYKLVRSACHMLWLLDRFEVLHVLD